jgi:triosephosphate isomerase (TIM)
MKQSVKTIIGNWKMNGLAADLAQAEAIRDGLTGRSIEHRVGLCLPATLIAQAAWRLKTGRVVLGGQDCHAAPRGAFTGSVSAEMLKDAGASMVIVGHSERRAGFGETDADVSAKVEAALKAGLEPVICVGETLDQRDAGRAVDIVTAQVASSLPGSLRGRAFAVAYEPIWAIGTGRTPTLEQIAEMHAAIRTAVLAGAGAETTPILYGGSVNPGNAAEILTVDGVGGALVGGASLQADDFLAIIQAA